MENQISTTLDTYIAEFKNHGLFMAAAARNIPLVLLKQFAFFQYSDSILWIPMLALMKSKAKHSTRLRQAIEDNIKCEAGVGGTSHVELAKNMIRSLGIIDLDGFPTFTFAKSAALWISEDFHAFAELEVAGWLLTAETLVPIMFELMQPSFKNIEGCDNRYFVEHITVDNDEHSSWMMEAVEDVIRHYGHDSIPHILAGMKDAYEETLEVPNYIDEIRRDMVGELNP